MLRFTQCVNAEQAKSYYTEGLAREDYYTRDQEVVGQWLGKGAAALGLKGAVSRESFAALCNNKNPNTNLNLTKRQNDNRRVGYDINFHAPKSVSLLYAIHQNPEILDAFRDSVRTTMSLMEEEMKTRVRRRGRQDDRITGNMVWAEFAHFTSRPVEGVSDPHLHIHAFAMNATFDPLEKCWKAGQFGDLKTDSPYFEAVFHSELAGRLRELGYPIERRAKGWELAGITRETIRKFSKRTREIERIAREKGLTSAKAKDQLGAATRERKDRTMSQSDLRANWQASLTPEESQSLKSLDQKLLPDSWNQQREDAKSAYAHAIEHAFERSSAVRERKLDELALRRGVGCVRRQEVEQERARRVRGQDLLSRLSKGEALVTSRAVLREERWLVNHAKEGRGACRPLGRPPTADLAPELSKEQARAVDAVLRSRDRITLLRGRAGVGKTTIMRQVVAGIESSGKRVVAFAPSAQASRGLLRAEGFSTADTVAKLLSDQKLQEGLRGQVIWIDEAGLLGSPTLAAVFRLAKAQGARVLLSGDSGQHAPVERGDALRLLETAAGLQSPALKEVRRQRGTYREAVMALSEGRVTEGMHRLDELGAIKERAPKVRLEEMAKEYADATGRGQSVLAISPTHAEGRRVSALIREELKKQGRLSESGERPLATLHALGWTEAERRDPGNYEPGLVVQFHRHAKGFPIGARAVVVSRDGDHVDVVTEDGSQKPLPLQQAGRFSVHEQEETRLAPGDLLRVTQNGRSACGRHRIHNGSVHQLVGFSREGDLRLANGWVLPRQFGHLTHGYVTTSHSAQGRTVDRVLIAQGDESLRAGNKEQFYVSVSRGREGVSIYTEDRAALLHAVSKSGQRLSATELMQGPEVRYEKVATLASRLAAHARTWATRQAARLSEFTRERGRSGTQVLLDRRGAPLLQGVTEHEGSRNPFLEKHAGAGARAARERIRDIERD